MQRQKGRDQIDKFSALVGNFISESSEVVHVQVDETNMKIVSLNSPQVSWTKLKVACQVR